MDCGRGITTPAVGHLSGSEINRHSDLQMHHNFLEINDKKRYTDGCTRIFCRLNDWVLCRLIV